MAAKVYFPINSRFESEELTSLTDEFEKRFCESSVLHVTWVVSQLPTKSAGCPLFELVLDFFSLLRSILKKV